MNTLTKNPLFSGSILSTDDLVLVGRFDLTKFELSKDLRYAIIAQLVVKLGGEKADTALSMFERTYDYPEIMRRGEKEDHLFSLYLAPDSTLHWIWTPKEDLPPAKRTLH